MELIIPCDFAMQSKWSMLAAAQKLPQKLRAQCTIRSSHVPQRFFSRAVRLARRYYTTDNREARSSLFECFLTEQAVEVMAAPQSSECLIFVQPVVHLGR
eukprot:gnl/TRDRNA2_/TRDRNA2_67161_c0_seq1.p1 gnl/TRDRNA2_/TRDRNA2_67161_c0~~gnl/TRDRNA2_/TRDRNA2_67161_c0_seq1.p1  ORF type:complete len:100 (+),score=2.35 gnl/TRDRNA2_/TRDRNA2_67161_c0_seq1:105-404(+)